MSESRSPYVTSNTPATRGDGTTVISRIPGKPFYCKSCGETLGYIQRRLITIITNEDTGASIARQMNVLQRVSHDGMRGDLIIGDADIVCSAPVIRDGNLFPCGTVRRWDFRRAW